MADIGTAPNKSYQRTDGVRTGAAVNQVAAANSVKNTAALADARENDIATALNNRIMRDGGNKPSANLPMAGYKHTGVGDASADDEYAAKGQMDDAITAAIDALAISAYIATLLPATDADTARTTLELPTYYQPLNAILTDLAANDTIPAPVGTKIVLSQTTAPTGWTKDTTHNDKALRVVSGTVSSGGTAAFSTVFAARTISASNLPVSCPWPLVDPGHTHVVNAFVGGYGVIQSGSGFNSSNPVTSNSSTTGISHGSNSGGGQTMDFAVQYVDTIICTRNARA